MVTPKRPRDASPLRPRDASQWKIINSMDIEPHALVGERVRVWWEQDQRFYAGKVAAFNPETWQHEVHYQDGEVHKELLVLDRVQVMGTAWPAPSPEQLLQLGGLLSDRAEQEAAKMQAPSKGGSRPSRQRDTGAAAAVKRLEQAAWLVMTKAVQMQEQSQHQEKEQELHQHSRQRNQLLQQQVKGQQQQDQEQQQQQQRRQQPSLPSRGLHASKRVALAISRAPDPASASQPAAAASPRQPVVQATPQQLAGVEAPVEVLRPASPSKAVRRRQADQDGGQRKAPRVNTHPCVQAAQQKQRQPTQAIASEEVQTDAAVAVAALPSRVQRRRTSKQALPLQVAGSGTLEQAAQQSGPCLNVQVELEQQVSVSSQDGSEAAVRKASRGTSPQLAQDMAAAAVLVASHTALEQGAASRHAAAGTKCVKVGSAVVAVAAEAQAAPAAAAPAGAQDNSAAVTEAGAADTTQQAVSADAAASTAAVAQGATLVAATAPPLGINSAPVAARPTVAAKTSRPATLPRPQASAAAAATAAAAAKAAGNVQFTEVDVTLSMAPEALVGMPIKVYWPLDRQFYTGKAVSYDASTCKHRISYADGDAEERVLAVDRVQVGLRVQDRGRQPAPTSQQLKDLTAAVEKVANEMQVQGSNRRQVDAVRQRAAAIAAAAAATAEAEARRDAEFEDPLVAHGAGPECPGQKLLPLEAWRSVPGGKDACHVLQPDEAQELGASLLGACAQFQQGKGQFAQFRELDLAYRLSPRALVGREVRVYWPSEDAWFLGRVSELDEVTGQHVVDYADGDREVLHLAVEAVRLLVHAGEEVPLASSSGVRAAAEQLQRAGERLVQGMEVDGEDGGAAKGHRLLNKASEMVAWADVRQQQEQDEAAAAAAAAAAADAAQQQAQEQGTLPDEEHPQEAAAGTSSLNEPSSAGQQHPAECPTTVDVESVRRLQPGEPAWAYLKGHTPWPCVLITREEAARTGVSGVGSMTGSTSRARNTRCVNFFGDYTSSAVPVMRVLPFACGVQLGLHNPRFSSVARRRMARFRAALLEALSYLREGELPRPMVPENNDDAFTCDSDADASDGGSDGEEETAGAARRKAGGQHRQPEADIAGLTLPLKVSSVLTLHYLGRVEWLNPNFHTERHIFPIGYRVSRLCSTPASNKQEAVHTFEVLTAADGLRPLFRVTPQGGLPVEGSTAAAAFTALWDCDPASKAKSLQRTGVEAFGLTNRRIASLIRSLPGAARCDKYRVWPEGVPPGGLRALSPQEQLARTAVLASLQQLPQDIASQPSRGGVSWECEVCGEDTEQEGSYLLHCDGCQLCVHMDCIGEERPPDGSLWLCDLCQLKRAGLRGRGPPCALCPVQGGPMKRTTDGRWCHLVCAMWVPEVGFTDPDRREPIEGVERVTTARRKLLCCFCRQPYGAPIQCAGGRSCFTAFHPMCARNAGLPMVMEAAPDLCSSDSDEEQRDGASAETAGAWKPSGPGALAEVPVVAADRSRAVDKENVSGSEHMGGSDWGAGMTGSVASGPAAGRQPLGQLPAPGQLPPQQPLAKPSQHQKHVAVKLSAKGKGGAKVANWEEGTRAGGHRLLCFCSKHSGMALAGPERKRVYMSLQEDQGGVADTERQHATAGSRGAGQKPAASAPAAAAQGRGLAPALAPTAAASDNAPGATRGSNGIGISKACPPQQQQQQQQHAAACTGIGAHAYGSARCIAFGSRRSRGPREPETLALAAAKRVFVKATPYLVTTCLRQAPVLDLRLRNCASGATAAARAGTAATAAAAAAAIAHAAPGVADAGQEGRMQGSAGVPDCRTAGPGQVDCGQGGVARQATCVLPRSMAERYADMKATLRLRLTCGKSAIHGLGAIAKAPHKAGDMVIEYVGELIRPSVADVRERTLYNRMVGCGTYIFGLSESACVDATRSGNMAHLLNHSCNPNCISRTITVRSPATGELQDHVIIFAKRDLQPGEELTYDYRFSGDEKLPCNCGALNCRGFVNVAEAAGTASVFAPRAALELVLP